MSDARKGHPGHPGQPGKPGTERQGGAGGTGGEGGEGGVTGGPGGTGGAGGRSGEGSRRKWVRIETWIFAALVLFGAVSIGLTNWQVQQQNHKIEMTSNENHRAICALRKNTEGQIMETQAQIDSTVEFLRTHPGPEPIPGISREVLNDGLQRQRDTLQRQQDFVGAIAFVRCA